MALERNLVQRSGARDRDTIKMVLVMAAETSVITNWTMGVSSNVNFVATLNLIV